MIVFQASVMMDETDKLQSVGYKNIAIHDKHVNSQGDLLLSVRSVISLRSLAEDKLNESSGSPSAKRMRRSPITYPLIWAH